MLNQLKAIALEKMIIYTEFRFVNTFRIFINPFKTDFFLSKIGSFYQFIESDSQCSHKNFMLFKETIFLVCYAKSQFASRAFDI
jgi:hypothetical protein